MSASYSTGRFYKYGRDHAAECMCSDCVARFNIHQSRGCNPAFSEGNRHICQSCQEHITWLNKRERGVTVATVNFCEREQCGAMGKSHAMGTIQMRASDREQNRAIEVCPACYGDFIQWLKYAPATERDRAYSQPYSEAEEPDMVSATDLEGLLAAALTRALQASGRQLPAGPTTKIDDSQEEL